MQSSYSPYIEMRKLIRLPRIKNEKPLSADHQMRAQSNQVTNHEDIYCFHNYNIPIMQYGDRWGIYRQRYIWLKY